jgi:hypothetical protein
LSFEPPSHWTNQELVLYHGTIDFYQESILSGVSVLRGRSRKDFGRGFYTTTRLAQAREFASKVSQRIAGSQPIVIRWTLSRDQLARLESVWFVRGGADASDYWGLIGYCRSGGVAQGRVVNHGWYDVAVGPVMRSPRRRTVYPGYDQISFHTPASESVLNATHPIVI